MQFYRAADSLGLHPQVSNAAVSFKAFADKMRERVSTGEIGEPSFYALCLNVAIPLARILKIRTFDVLRKAGVFHPKEAPPGMVATTQSTSIEEALEIGKLAICICKALTLEVLRGPLPITIPLANGYVHHEWCRMHDDSRIPWLANGAKTDNQRYTIKRRASRSANPFRPLLILSN